MSDARNDRTGGCLCGSVSYSTGGVLNEVLQCHCENCRRLSGNFVAAVRADTAELRIDDPDGRFRWHDLDYAKYGFCQGCGSTLFFRPTATPEITSVMVGTLDDSSALSLEAIWFSEEAQPHNVLSDAVSHFRGNG